MIALRVLRVALFERMVPFVRPFRFGAVTVDAAPQAYVRVEVDVDGAVAVGGAAEMMVPKWFDKDPAKSPAQTVDGLRRSLALAGAAYAGARGGAFAIHAERHADHAVSCAAQGIPALAAAFGPAQLDKAVLDGLFRAVGVGAWEGLRRNLAGLDGRLTPDLDDAAITAFLASRAPRATLPVRHAVGLLDPLEDLPRVLAATGCRHVKLKLSGDPAADRQRLAAIAAVLPAGIAGASVDANEQYAPDALPELAALLGGAVRAGLRLMYVEQPVDRSWAGPLGSFGDRHCCVLDEGDDSYDAFPRALALGWRGVSSKSCKGLYKALLNALRVSRAGALMTAEDLTCQPGLGLQQDTVLAAFLGLPHAERNGHCYAAGFVDPDEAARFGAAHPDLYDGPRLRLADGMLPASRLGAAIGYGSGAHPDWAALPPPRLPVPA